MRAGPVVRAATGGLARRRVQTIVIGLVLLVSTGASVLAVALLADSSSPFDHAFAVQHGADIVAAVDPAKATSAELTATKRLPEVTAAAGPFGEVTVTPKAAMAGGGDVTLPPTTLVGRASPGDKIDHIALQSGHWATRPGQLVLSSDPSPGSNFTMTIGTRLTLASLPGKPVLTVVGVANSVNSSAGGWVVPGEIAKLRAPGTPAAAQMMYRFRSAGSAAGIRADLAALARVLPPGTVTGTQSYLAVKAQESSNIGPWVPFVVAFGVIGLVMSVLIVANVVSGAVVAGYQRIGVLKSIGFSPGQVVAAYTGQAGVPAVVGCLGGVVLGNLLAVPILGQTANVYGVGRAARTGLGGRGRAGGDVLPGRASQRCCPRCGRPAQRGAGDRSRARATAGPRVRRAPAVRPAGAATPGDHRAGGPVRPPGADRGHPGRDLLGAAAVTFAVGLCTSLGRVAEGLSHSSAEPVQIFIPSASPGGPGLGTRHAHPQIRAGRGTVRVRAATDGRAGAAGGDGGAARAAGDRALRRRGRGPDGQRGRAVAAGGADGLPRRRELDRIRHGQRALVHRPRPGGRGHRLPHRHRQVRRRHHHDDLRRQAGHARIVGQVFDTDNNGLAIITGWQTLAGADHGLAVDQYDIGLRPGTSASAYAQALGSRLGPAYIDQRQQP